LPCQTYFWPTAIKLPSNCHHSLPKSALCSPTHDWLPQRAGATQLHCSGDPHDSLEERLSLPFVEHPYRVGPLSRQRNALK